LQKVKKKVKIQYVEDFMSKETKDGKSETITINVKKDMRERIDILREGNIQFSGMVLSNFLGYLVGLGIKEAEIRVIEDKKKEDARLKAASEVPDVRPSFVLEIAKLRADQNLMMEALETGKTLDELRAERSSVISPGVRKKAQKQTLGSTTRPPEALSGGEPEESTGISPIYDKDRV
jgi:hypothetical protein